MFLFMIIVRQEYYHKWHKLNERKILQLNPNVGKTFVGLASSVLKVRKKACRKSAKTVKLFSHLICTWGDDQI